MKFRTGRITSAGLTSRIPGATNPPNAAEGRARNRAAAQDHGDRQDPIGYPEPAEDGVAHVHKAVADWVGDEI